MKNFILFLFLCVNLLSAQEGTPLFQVVTSGLTNQRAPVLRELQNELHKLNSENITGADLQILRDKIDDLKEKLAPFIQPLKFKIESDNLSLQYGSHEITAASSTALNTSLDSLNDFLKDEIQKIVQSIKSAIYSKTRNKEIANILFYITYELIDKGEITAITYSSSIPYDAALTNILASKTTSEIKSFLKNYLTTEQLNQNTAEIIVVKGEEINSKLRAIHNSYNNWFVGIFNEAKLFIKNEIEKPISRNLKGLTGLSVREGSGTFSGGVLYSFRTSVNLKMSLYTNLNFNDGADSSAFSLIGAKLSWAPNTWQFDWLVSAYWGNEEYKSFDLFEAGMSISNNFGGSVVLGLAGFYIHNSSQSGNNFYSAGLYIKISDAAPALTVGITGNTDNPGLSPIFQIHYPLTVSL